MHVPIYVKGKTERALIDSGATGCFIDRSYVENNKLQTTLLAKPLRVRNVDNTEDVAGMITEKVSVLFSLGERTETQEFFVTELGKQAFILGLPWLVRTNPYGFIPKRSKVYRIDPVNEKAFNEFIDENLKKGYIRKPETDTPQAAGFFFVPKKDGKVRPVQDYRYLNEWTVKNSYPLPRIDELVDSLHGKSLFTKMDVRWGYNNVRIREGDEWKAAFVSKRGIYEPTVMFFGLTNSPATFQNMMDTIFAIEIAQDLYGRYSYRQ